MEANEILEKFIADEKWKICGGSGDDAAYCIAIENYVNEQRKFWLDAIKTLTQREVDKHKARDAKIKDLIFPFSIVTPKVKLPYARKQPEFVLIPKDKYDTALGLLKN